MSTQRNIAARVGGWSARHWKTAVGGWVAFVVLAFMIGGSVGTNTLKSSEAGVGESGHAEKIAAEAFPEKADEVVLLTSATLKVDDPRYRAAVADVSSRLGAIPGVTEVESPYAGDRRGVISKDRSAAMVGFTVPGDMESDRVTDTVDATVAAVKAAGKDHAGIRIEQMGSVSSEEAFMKVFNDDLAKASTTSLPLTLLLLLVAFGALVAAGLPVLLAITAVIATMGLVGPISQIAPVSDGVMHVILLIGLAVGVDYSLFYLRRAREERDAGHDTATAVDIAAATSGRAVLVSGITVMTSMAGMYLAGASDFSSFATGTIAVVGVSMLASLTVLPALMSRLGTKVDRGRVPGLAGLKRRMAALGLWSRLVDRVMRRPLAWGLATTAVLVALSIPALGMQIGEPSTDTLPRKYEVVQTFDRMQEAFPADNGAATVVVEADDVTTPAVQGAITRLQHDAANQGGQFPDTREGDVEISSDRTVARFGIGLAGDGRDDRSNAALDVLRDELVPATTGSVPGVRTSVSGPTAADRDFSDTMMSHLPYVFGFVIIAAFGLLLFTFRSIVVPIKAIVLNLLSVSAAYGVMTLIFNHGWLKGLLGFSETGPITAWIPLFLFVVLFGLSMDYHVFILSRVREAYDRGMSTGDAVAHAIKTTAGVVTSAAIVMVCVFAIFGTLSFMMFKQMGVGLAFAVLIDATLIRGILLPASMKLLGDRNWWLPKSLGWLPQVGHERQVAPAGA